MTSYNAIMMSQTECIFKKVMFAFMRGKESTKIFLILVDEQGRNMKSRHASKKYKSL